MPIKGLTDRGLSFPEIGQIRKGIKITKTRADGSEYQVPKDLEYFRVEFDDREQGSAAKFVQVYGNEPAEINIILPFDEIERCWDAWLEAYTAGRMVARSDGEKFIYLVDTKTGDIRVKDGDPFIPYKDGDPVGNDYEGKPIFCSPVGRLKIIVPELARAAYMTVHTTSIHDIDNLSQQLQAFKHLNDGVIRGIPLVLRRRPKKISIPGKDGQRVRMQKWLLSIEADPQWVRAKLGEVTAFALPDGESFTPLMEPEDYIEADITEPDFEVAINDPTMSLELAETVATRDGKFYKDFDDNELRQTWGAIQAKLNNIGDTGQDLDLLEELTLKRDAIIAILQSRQGQQMEMDEPA